MTIHFACSHCYKEYPKTNSDEEVVRKFKKKYPESNVNSAQLVCGRCYEIALRILEIQRERQNWMQYAMSN